MRRFIIILSLFLLGAAANVFLPPKVPAKPVEVSREAASTATGSAIPRETVRVTRVIDGDTIEVEGQRKVRYIGINTPEVLDPRKPVQCFGQEASAKNKELVEGKTVRLERDISQTDKYGRFLRYVYVGDIMVNDYLVREGFGQVSTFPPDVKYKDRLLEAQSEAKEHNRGLWAGCPVVTSGESR